MVAEKNKTEGDVFIFKNYFIKETRQRLVQVEGGIIKLLHIYPTMQWCLLHNCTLYVCLE